MDNIVRWEMIDYTTFFSDVNGWRIDIKVGAAYGACYWLITHNGKEVTNCFKHSPQNGELAGKVFAESILKEFIKRYNYNHE